MSDDKVPLFEDFTLDTARGCVLRGGEAVHLRPQAYGVLKCLVENRGRLVSKDDLIEEVWQGRAVTDGSLSKCIEEVRGALGDGAKRYIQNVPRRGYIFDPGAGEREAGEAASVRSEQLDVLRMVVEEEEETDGAGGTAPAAPPPTVAAESSGRVTARNKVFLRAAAGLLILSLAAGIAYYVFRPKSGNPANAAGVRSLAVLPFRPLLPGGRDEVLEMGMADTLIARLGGVGEVAVRPVSSVRRYTGLDQDAAQAGRELGVEAVLDGSIQRVGERIRVTARLVRVADGRQLWSGRFDEEFGDIFAVQDAICERVAAELALNLAGGRRESLTKHHTANADAYQLYLKGRYHWYKSTPADSMKAREYFQQAIDADPTFALAYSGLADFYGRSAALGHMRPEDGWPRHEAAVKKALELDPNIAEVYNSLAGLRLYYYRDLPGAEGAFKRALELDPNYVEAHAHYGGYLILLGRFDEALAHAKRAQELDPLSSGITRRFGLALFHVRRYDEAIRQYLRAIELDPGYALAHEDLGETYEQKKMYAEAVAAWRRAMTLSGDEELAATLERTYRESGFDGAVKAVSRKRLEQLGEKARRGGYVPAVEFARLYVRLGDREQAFAWLEKAYGERTRLIFHIKVDPLFDGLRADPRFVGLLRRLNLE